MCALLISIDLAHSFLVEIVQGSLEAAMSTNISRQDDSGDAIF